jgi:biopolymer transport protein ExbD
MAMTTAGNGGTRAVINMTPMIDVLLVLIIIFMVIQPSAQLGLQASIPGQENGPAAKAPTPLVISVGRDGLRLNQEAITEVALPARLAKVLRPGGDVFIRGERELDFGDVARVIDAARGAGAGRVGLMTR